MSAFDVITGNAVGDGFWRAYGTYTGNSGQLMTWVRDAGVPIDALIWVLIAAAGFLLIRDLKEEGMKGMWFPLGLIIVLVNFIFNAPTSLFMLYGAVIVMSAALMHKAKTMSQGGFMAVLLIIVGVSYLLLGSIWSLPIFGGLGAIAFWIIRGGIRSKEYGSKGERELMEDAGYQTKPERKIINKEHKAERKADKEGVIGDATEAEATAEERNVELEIHAAALASGVEDVSKKLTELNNAELSAEQRDMKVLEMARAVDSHLKAHALENADDVQKASDIRADIQRLVMTVGQIVKDETYADQYRYKTVKGIEHTTKVMTDAAEYAKVILISEIKAEKEVRQKADKEIKKLRDQMKKKYEQIKSIRKRIRRAKSRSEAEAMAGQMNNLEKQRAMIEKSLSEIDSIKAQIDNVLAKGRRVLKAMKAEASRIIAVEGEIEAFSQNMEKLEGHIGSGIEKMKDEFKEFQEAIAGLEHDSLPEEVVIKATPHSTAVFETTKKFITDTIGFNKDEVLPFISKNGELLKECWKIEKAADFGNKVSTYVTKALEKISLMAVAAYAGDHKKVKQAQDTIEIDKFQEKISNYADWKANKIKSQVKKSYGDLSEAIKSVNGQIEYLQKELQGVEEVEHETSEALNRAMTALTEIRNKQFQQMQGAAAQAQADLNKAKKFEKKEKRAA